MAAKIFTAIGLMSGTSMDGIDIAMIRSDGQTCLQTGATMFVAYDEATREILAQGLRDACSITNRTQRPGNLETLETHITNLHADAVIQFLHANDLQPADIDLIGFHGQTVLHRPQNALTLQLGNGQQLAHQTRIDVVCDLRANDMEFGGQGAPLVPVYHDLLARNLSETITSRGPLIFVNIGGISNLTYVDNTAKDQSSLIAFDCGPGNALIDQWIDTRLNLPFDKNGKIAAKGEVSQKWVKKYLSHPYFGKPVPKSLDRMDFAALNDNQLSTPDGARTLATITAASIERSLDHLPQKPATWIICGGGALNPVILSDLSQMAKAHNAQVLSAEQAGLSAMDIEAQAFAYLAIRSKLALPITWPKTTGCKQPATGGVLFNH